jgi:hypothetical protein
MKKVAHSNEKEFNICGRNYSAAEVENLLIKINKSKRKHGKFDVSNQSVLIQVPTNIFKDIWKMRSKKIFNLDAIILEIFIVGGYDMDSSFITPDDIKKSFSIDGNLFDAVELSFVINETSTFFTLEDISFDDTSGYGALFCFFVARELIRNNAFFYCASYEKFRKIYRKMIVNMSYAECSSLETMLAIDKHKWWYS